MLIQGIVNPHVLSLVSRVRHTNTLVIADAAFPFWPQIETVDISLVKGVPTVLQVLDALLPNWKCGQVFMAEEFKTHNRRQTQAAFAKACRGVPMTFEPHLEFKKRVPHAIGLIRTGDTTAYGNIILVSV
jgi:D-ribose pyranase